MTKFFSHAVIGKRRGTSVVLISIKFKCSKDNMSEANNLCVKILHEQKREEIRQTGRRQKQRRLGGSGSLTVLGDLPASGVLALTLLGLLALLLGFAHCKLMSLLNSQSNTLQCVLSLNPPDGVYVKTHLLLLDPLLALLLHSSSPPVLLQLLLQEFLLAFVHLLFVVQPGTLLPLQPAPFPGG